MAQTVPPEDVPGWNVIKWGMTVDEARKALGDKTQTSSEVPGPAFVDIEKLVIKDLPVGDLIAECGLYTQRNSAVVTSVSLVFGKLEGLPLTRELSFDTLKRLLIEKYGQPKNEDRKSEPDPVVGGQRVSSTVLWISPSTSITLLRLESIGYGTGYVKLTYRAADNKAKSVL
jgi:hypothetical protein